MNHTGRRSCQLWRLDLDWQCSCRHSYESTALLMPRIPDGSFAFHGTPLLALTCQLFKTFQNQEQHGTRQRGNKPPIRAEIHGLYAGGWTCLYATWREYGLHDAFDHCEPLSESPKPPSCSTRSESVSTEVSSDTLFRRPSWRTSRRMSFSCRRRHDGRLRSYGSTTVEPMSHEFKHHCVRNRVEKHLLCGFEHLSLTRCLDSCCCTQQRLQPMPTL